MQLLQKSEMGQYKEDLLQKYFCKLIYNQRAKRTAFPKLYEHLVMDG